MKINTIKIENFLSVKSAYVDFSDFNGLINIIGKNYDTSPMSSNGAGKSTMIEAIVFALFGKTIRKTSEKSVSNYYTKGKCKVTLVVNDDVEICRTKKPPSLHIKVGGKPQTKEGIQQTQAFLENYLNISYNVFLASIVFGQQNDMNFLTATAEEKRSIIQNFLNVMDLFKYRSKIRSIKAVHNNEKKIAVTLESESLQKTKKLKKKIEKLMADKKEFYSMFSKEQAEVISKSSLSDIKYLEENKDTLNLEYRHVENAIGQYAMRVNNAKSRITSLLANSECEHCGNRSSAIMEQIEKDEKIRISSHAEMAVMRKQLKSLAREIDEIYVPVNSQEFETLEALKTVDVELGILRKSVKEHQRTTRKYSKQMEAAQRKYEIMRFWELAFSEQGLVKYIIRHILEYFNDRANYYLGFLTAGRFSVTFDEVLDECIRNNGSPVLYESMSGGEKKKVSLAVMLALNDLLILSGKERSNLLFFDEVADSLDKEGVKGVCELMEILSTEKKVFIITHNDYLSSLIEDSAGTLTVVKRNKLTKIG